MLLGDGDAEYTDRKPLRGVATMNPEYTAVVKQQGEWWFGWVEEVPGVNGQEHSRAELLESLRGALQEVLELS